MSRWDFFSSKRFGPVPHALRGVAKPSACNAGGRIPPAQPRKRPRNLFRGLFLHLDKGFGPVKRTCCMFHLPVLHYRQLSKRRKPMVRFAYLDKTEKERWLPQLFDLPYDNMQTIASATPSTDHCMYTIPFFAEMPCAGMKALKMHLTKEAIQYVLQSQRKSSLRRCDSLL